MLKITTYLENTFYVEKEMLDIMKAFYVKKRNLIISRQTSIQKIHSRVPYVTCFHNFAQILSYTLLN